MQEFGTYGKMIKKQALLHMVEESIDTGAILTQKEIKLDDNFTALSLLDTQHKLAIASFKEALKNLENKIFKIQTLGGGVSQKIGFAK